MTQGPADGGGRSANRGHHDRPIELFIVLDRMGAIGGAVLVVVANSLLRNAQIWLILPSILLLVAALTVARRMVADGRRFVPLILITVGNWQVAVVVAAILPFLWPVMAITVLMPMVLATPYLDRRRLAFWIAASAVVAGLVSAAGLLSDDGGAIPDIADEFELGLVVGALMAQIAPIGLIVWQNNRLQRENLSRANALNADLQDSQTQLAASRRRVVEAGDTERRRIERDLHDGAQQRLVALGVRLRLLESQSAELPEVHAAVGTLVGELDEAVEEVRELAHGIYPPLLRSRGLVDALRAVARRSPLEVRPELADVGRLDPSLETALYFTALEALTNAAKHAPGASVDLVLGEDGERLALTVSDDGPGFEVDDEIRSQGTHNMGDRVASIGGELVISSVPGRGTTVRATVARPPGV